MAKEKGPGWVSNSLAGTGRSRGHRQHLFQGHPGGNPAEMSDAFGTAVAAWPRFLTRRASHAKGPRQPSLFSSGPLGCR